MKTGGTNVYQFIVKFYSVSLLILLISVQDKKDSHTSNFALDRVGYHPD